VAATGPVLQAGIWTLVYHLLPGRWDELISPTHPEWFAPRGWRRERVNEILAVDPEGAAEASIPPQGH
jgi:hypothetical protein